MVEAIEWLRLLVVEHRSLEYIIIFFGAVLGGELALFALGFLAAQNVVSTLPVIFLGFIGAFIPNILWFLLGKTVAVSKIISHRYANTATSAITEAVYRVSRGNHLMGIIIAKFLVGTPFILMMYVSKTSLKFKDFLYYESVAILLSMIIIISIGFISGLGFTYFADILQNIYAASGLLLLAAILIIMFQLWIKRVITSAHDQEYL